MESTRTYFSQGWHAPQRNQLIHGGVAVHQPLSSASQQHGVGEGEDAALCTVHRRKAKEHLPAGQVEPYSDRHLEFHRWHHTALCQAELEKLSRIKSSS